ncbi:MAG TPA: glycosyltransferase [Mycobacteriales bacterium]|nr:glycosyltransferase [Mycobacteriales bacterium]
MRVLWLSPWLRPLSRVHVEALRARGAQALLVTSDRHPESGPRREYELLLEPRPKSPGTWPAFARTLRAARAFRPDVVVVELVWDPRWLAFAALAPVVHLIHDDRPHDATEERPGWQRRLFERWSRQAARLVVFSDHVRDSMAAVTGRPLTVVPLTSDLADRDAPAPVPAGQRHDMVLVGRLGPYKNLPVVLSAWQRHVSGPGWRGDRLVLYGDGAAPGPLPDQVRWDRRPFSYHEAVPAIAAAKASIVHYRRASQSGVQVLSMQLGVTPIVSPEGALPQFQPPDEKPVGVEDVGGLAAAFDALADPGTAAARGAVAARHYQQHYAARHAAERLIAVFAEVAG